MPKRCGGLCSTSCTASRICNRRRSRGSAEASHRQPYSWRRARAHRGVPKRCSVFGTVCLSRVIGPSVTSCLSSSRNIGSTSSTKVVQVPGRSSHDAGAITICGGTGVALPALGVAIPASTPVAASWPRSLTVNSSTISRPAHVPPCSRRPVTDICVSTRFTPTHDLASYCSWVLGNDGTENPVKT
jgi:hypothetical protein